MAREPAITRYRRWYRKLLRFHSKAYRERFGEGMEQTFHDLCRERAGAGRGLGGFVLWMFVDTAAGILRENGRSLVMHNKNILRLALGTGLILLVPLLAGAPWGPLDFVFMGGLLFGTGLTYELVARKGGTTAYRVAVGIACAAGLLLVWVNAAVGIIGDEEVANAMYLGVIVVGFIGAYLARFEASGMSRALFAMAAVQALVPLIAMTWVSAADFAPGIAPVLGLNAFFVAAWIASGLLFRRAANVCRHAAG